MKIYITRYNADMTEGRGPMINSHAFAFYQDAVNYIDTQPGIMGRKGKWSEEKYGDWEIATIEVFEGPYDPMVELKARALAKLTAEERAALGLE